MRRRVIRGEEEEEVAVLILRTRKLWLCFFPFRIVLKKNKKNLLWFLNLINFVLLIFLLQS